MSFKKARSVSRMQTRPAVRVSSSLEKNLLAYATAAGAGLLSAALPAAAEVIYTPSNTPMAIAQLNHGPVFTPLDLDNDGKPDFKFGMSYSRRYSSSGSTTQYRFFLKIDPGQGNGAVLGQGSAASAIPKGVAIGPQQQFGKGDLYLHINSFRASKTGFRSSGTWNKVEYAYVGLKLLINGQVHYGWARVKFPSARGIKYPSIYGYAYESVPNQPIVPGQTSGTAPESAGASAPATLGMLAVGASGLNVWREQNSVMHPEDVR